MEGFRALKDFTRVYDEPNKKTTTDACTKSPGGKRPYVVTDAEIIRAEYKRSLLQMKAKHPRCAHPQGGW